MDVHEARGHVLLIETPGSLQSSTARALGGAGWSVVTAASADAALAACAERNFDLVLLDLRLRQMEGADLLTQVRARSDAPILGITTPDDLDDPAAGFEAGADDYIVKPFELPELELRIRTVLRRVGNHRMEDILHGPSGIRMQLRAHEVFVADRRLHLTPKEFELLRMLVSRRGEVVGPDQLSVEIWGYETFGSRNYVEAHVSRLRAKLAEAGVQGVIGTVRGVGYMIR